MEKWFTALKDEEKIYQCTVLYTYIYVYNEERLFNRVESKSNCQGAAHGCLPPPFFLKKNSILCIW